jgi:hypothetical protein
MASLDTILKDKSDATPSDHRGSKCRHCFTGSSTTTDHAAAISATGTRLSVIGFRPRACLSKIGLAHGFQSDKLGRSAASVYRTRPHLEPLGGTLAQVGACFRDEQIVATHSLTKKTRWPF